MQQTTSKKNVFFTHNKEKATRNRFRGVKSDENKFIQVKRLASPHTRRRKPHVTHTQQGGKPQENRFRVKSDENKLKKNKTPCFSTHKEEKATRNRFKGRPLEPL